MTILQAMGRNLASAERIVQAKEFIAATRYLILGGGRSLTSRSNALDIAQHERCSERIIQIIKAATDAMSLANSAALSPFTTSAQAWFESLVNISAFDTMLPAM